MNTNNKQLLWRVDWCHRAGYQAPHQEVWAKTRKEAVQLAKTKSRLADFPQSWSIRLTDVTAEYELEQRLKKNRKSN